MKKTTWTIRPGYMDKDSEYIFQSLENVFAVQGEPITLGRLGATSRVTVGGHDFYVKLYRRAGRGVRHWIGRSRLRGEWENLIRFEKWGIPCAPLAAYGMEKSGLFFKRGAIVTKGLPETDDLEKLAEKKDPRLSDQQWVAQILRQLSAAARTLHRQGFTHNDFKWRNILVSRSNPPQVFLIDCPLGGFWIHPFLQYRKNKDLACLDKVAKKVLSRTQRLRFFLDYLEQERLDRKNKKQLVRILNFFNGRE